MKILVSGATGFLGKALIPMLRKKHEVYTLSTSFSSDPKHFKIDLRKPFKIPLKFDVVIHLAAKIYYTWLPWFHNFKKLKEVNVEGTKNLINACETEYFIYVSTLSVYNLKDRENIEKNPIHPKCFYGLTKYQGELICQRLSKIKKFKLLIIRFPMIYDFKDPRRETKLFIKFYPFLKFLKPLLQKKINVMERRKAVKLILNFLEEKREGIVNVKGDVIPLVKFIERIEKFKNQLQNE